MRVTSYPPRGALFGARLRRRFRKPRPCSLYSLAYDDRKRKRIYVSLIPQGGKFFYLCTRTITQEPKHARKRGGREGTDWTSQELFERRYKPRKASKALPDAAAGGGGTAEPEGEVERLAGGR